MFIRKAPLRNKFGRNNNYCDMYLKYKTIEHLLPQFLILRKGCVFPFVYVSKHVCISLHACPYRHFPFNILFIGGGGFDPLWREVEVNISFNVLVIWGGGFDPLWRLVVFEGPAWGKYPPASTGAGRLEHEGLRNECSLRLGSVAKTRALQGRRENSRRRTVWMLMVIWPRKIEKISKKIMGGFNLEVILWLVVWNIWIIFPYNWGLPSGKLRTMMI